LLSVVSSLLVFLFTAPAFAASADVPLDTLTDAPPQSGTLSNGIDWNVAGGGADPLGWGPGGGNEGLYFWSPAAGDQIWSFVSSLSGTSIPVNLSFTVTDLQFGPDDPQGEEGVVLPAGTTCDVSGMDPAWGFTFDAATATLAHTGPTAPSSPKNGAETALIPCALNNTTSALILNSAGFHPTAQRGLHSLKVTTPTLTTRFTGLPSSLPPGQTAHGTLTCTNANPPAPDPASPDALNAGCAPTATGGTISNLACTPATPVAALHGGDAIACTFDLTAPNTSTVDIQLTGAATADGLPDATTRLELRYPAIQTPVPTLSEMALILLALLLGASAVAVHRRGR
jgi:hypothetical protein